MERMATVRRTVEPSARADVNMTLGAQPTDQRADKPNVFFQGHAPPNELITISVAILWD
jgi:hypothetical protein